jgi:hypothetical protein
MTSAVYLNMFLQHGSAVGIEVFVAITTTFPYLAR